MHELPARTAGRLNTFRAVAAMAALCLTCTTAVSSELRKTPLVKAVLEARPSIVNIHGEKLVAAECAPPTAAGAPARVLLKVTPPRSEPVLTPGSPGVPASPARP